MIATGRDNNLTPARLRLMRYAMFAGVLAFGALAQYQAAHPKPDAGPPPDLTLIRYAGYGLCAAAIVALAVLRQVRARAEDPQTRMTLSLVGTSLGEAVGLMGGIIVILGGEPWVYLLGVLVFLASWAMLPADPAQDA